MQDDVAVGPAAVPRLGDEPGYRMDVPRELVTNGWVGPLERRSNGVVMVPVGPGPRRRARPTWTRARLESGATELPGVEGSEALPQIKRGPAKVPRSAKPPLDFHGAGFRNEESGERRLSWIRGVSISACP